VAAPNNLHKFVKYLVENSLIAVSYWRILNGDSLADELFTSGTWKTFEKLINI